MSTLLVPWVAFPLLFVALSWGCGLLLERVSGLKLPGALVVPCGFAVVALVAQFAVLTDATAELATPAVIVTAVAGFVVVRPWRSLHVDWWAIASGVGAFAAYAAPIVLSGAATFAGYIKLDDDSTLTALVDRAMEHGRSVDGLEFSTYFRVVDLLLDEGYPLASLLPLGIGHEIVRSDALWLYQPAMAVMAAMLALGLYALAGRSSRPAGCARSRPSSARSRRCSTGTRSGAASRRWERRGRCPSWRRSCRWPRGRSGCVS